MFRNPGSRAIKGRGGHNANWKARADDIFVGMSWDYDGIEPPPYCLFRYGQAISRIKYYKLFAVITKVVTATATNASATLTAVSEDLRFKGILGAKVEGTNIPAGTTITAVAATTLTMSAAATPGTSTGSIRLIPHGNGDGSATFNVPDDRDAVNAGRGDMGGTDRGLLTASGTGNPGLDATKLGAFGGVDRYALITAQLAVHNHGVTDPGHNHTQNAHNHGVTDPTHNHTQNAHNHGVTDPTHAHGVYDPGHSHAATPYAFVLTDGSPYDDGGALNNRYTTSTYNVNTNGALTSVAVNAAYTGVTVNNATPTNNAVATGVTVNNATPTNNSATTGVTVNNAGSGEAHPNIQPTRVTNKVIYTGVL